jgi:hypothetical protein
LAVSKEAARAAQDEIEIERSVMGSATIKDIVDLIAVVAMLALPLIILWHRMKTGKSIAGARMIQLLALVMLIPVILIFGLTGTIDSSTLGTLLAAIAGMFSGISNYEPRSGTNPRQAREDTGDDPPPDPDK